MITLTFTGHAREVLDEMRELLGSQTPKGEWKNVGAQVPANIPTDPALLDAMKSAVITEAPKADIPAGAVVQAVVVEPFTPTGISVNVVTAEEPKRKRRTKAEIEAEKAANITATPEDRVDPEVEAQDAADEAAETEQTDDAPKVFGRDDVRSRMTTLLGLMPGNEAEKYQKFAALATPIFNAVLGTPPDGETWRIGLIADNADHFALLCEGFDIAIRGASNV